MNRLESRKQLLLSESELNRALLVQQCQSVAIAYQVLADQASNYGSLASAAVTWVRGLQSSDASSQPESTHSANATAENLITGTQLLLDIWQEIQSLRGK
jgi:hypothetical protein